MSDEIRDGVSLEAPAAGQVPENAPAQGEAEKAVMEGMRLYREEDYRGVLALLRPWADRGEAAAALLVSESYKKLDDPVRCRNYLFMAANEGHGEAALLLAREYAREGDGVAALEWAEKAHELKIVGAGQLMLRLGKYKDDWETVVWEVLSELDWLPDEECLALCRDLKEVLEGRHIPEKCIPELVEPSAQKLMSRNPVAANILLEPCRELQKKLAAEEAARKERERKDEEQRKAVAKSRKAGKAAKAFRGPISVLLCIALAVGLNMVIHAVVGGQWTGFGTMFAALFGGYINCALNYWGMSICREKAGGYSSGGFMMTWITIVKWAIPCAIVGAILSGVGLVEQLLGPPHEIALMRTSTILLSFVCGLYGRFGDGW